MASRASQGIRRWWRLTLKPVTRPSLAKLLKLSERTLERYEAAGVFKPTARPVRGRTSRYALSAVLPLILAHVSKPQAPTETKARKEAADLRRAEAAAETAELRAAVARAELVNRKDAEAAWSSHVLAVRARLLSLSAHARVRGVDAAAAATFDELLRGALATLASVDEPEGDE